MYLLHTLSPFSLSLKIILAESHLPPAEWRPSKMTLFSPDQPSALCSAEIGRVSLHLLYCLLEFGD